MSRLFSTQELHIEISSKCTLKCPRCPRTELDPDGLNQEISLAQFKKAFPVPQLQNIKKIVFCGDIGDPIYATEFVDIVAYIKSFSAVDLSIVTNGSYKKTAWWEALGQWLSNRDTVTFSVDGWDQESNEKYRVNSDWDSIIAGINALRASSDCRIGWSSIYFNFNEDRMEQIKALATELGCDEFQVVSSNKFDGRYSINGIDPLKPINSNNVAHGVYIKAASTINRPKPIHMTYIMPQGHEWARCLQWKKELFINVEGLVFPCPWFNSGYQQNDFVEKYRDRLSVKDRSLEEILDDPMWEEFITRIETMPLDVCRIKCRDCR